MLEPDVEQVEDLHRHDRVDDERARLLERQPANRRPVENGESAGDEQEGDENDPPHEERREERLGRGTRRAAHRSRLGRLEGEGEVQRDGRDHVDPQYLQRRDRKRQAEQDRGDDGQGFTAIGRQRESDHLLEIVVDGAPFAHRRDDRREIVVGKHHVGGFLGGLGALAAHRHADIRLFERRRIVDSVSGHRDDSAAALERTHQPQLVLGTGPGEDGGLARHRVEIFVRRPLQVRPRRRRARLEPQLARYCRGGRAMVAGDHLHLDAGRAAILYRCGRFLAGRVDETDQAEQDRPFKVRRPIDRLRAGRERPDGQGEDPLSRLGHRLGTGKPAAPVERGVGARAALGRAQLEQPLGCALDVKEPLSVHLVQRCHVTLLGLERDRIEPRMPLPRRRWVEARLHRKDEQSRLHRIAVRGPAIAAAVNRGIVAQERGEDEMRDERAAVGAGHRLALPRQQLPFGIVADARHA